MCQGDRLEAAAELSLTEFSRQTEPKQSRRDARRLLDLDLNGFNTFGQSDERCKKPGRSRNSGGRFVVKPTSPVQVPSTGRITVSGTGATGPRRTITREEFAREFAGVSRALWCIAAAVVGQRSRAEDVVQEAAMAAWQKIDDFEAGTSFLAWMGKFVRYTALNEARRQRMRAAAPLDGVDAQVSKSGAAQDDRWSVTSRGAVSADQTGFDDHVVSALNDLDETARACLLLRTVHDMAYRDIALVLDVPEGTAMSHVHRARKLMRDQLAEHYEQTSGRSSA